MPEQKPLSPEKELLRLIEEGKKESFQVKKTTWVRQGRGLFSFGAWRGRFSFLKDNFFKTKRSVLSYGFNLLWLNRILEGVVIFLCFYLIHNIVLSFNTLNKIPALEAVSFKVKGSVMDVTDMSILKKSSSYYLEKVSQRDIFNIEKKAQIVTTKSSTEAVQEALKSLKLVGISWSENPDAMIEDSRAMRTFFVKTGQTFGDFKVKAIFKDRVILLYNNEEIELK
ncbi:MAG: hypothetical protein NC826_06535 [Candidatus Omnitrophica bacterium]|nr:hypothetical protein [Candidatus Omnitrophota bacterium]